MHLRIEVIEYIKIAEHCARFVNSRLKLRHLIG